MGVPTITSSSSNPYEAESICSLLYHQSLVTHVISEDTDVLVYDAPLLRRVTTLELEDQPKKRVGYEMSITHPGDVREGLGFEGERGREMFVDWCLLCGTDFTERLPSCVSLFTQSRRWQQFAEGIEEFVQLGTEDCTHAHEEVRINRSDL